MKLTTLDVLPTTVYSPDRKRFHPAVRNNLTVAYWPEVTYENEDDAYQSARRVVQFALDAANEVVEAWPLKIIGEEDTTT